MQAPCCSCWVTPVGMLMAWGWGHSGSQAWPASVLPPSPGPQGGGLLSVCPLPCLRAGVPPGCDLPCNISLLPCWVEVAPSCDIHASACERGGACRPGQVGGQDGHHVAPGGQGQRGCGPSNVPIQQIPRECSADTCQGPRGRRSVVKETRWGCWGKGRRPGTRWHGVRPRLLGTTRDIFQGWGQGRARSWGEIQRPDSRHLG